MLTSELVCHACTPRRVNKCASPVLSSGERYQVSGNHIDFLLVGSGTSANFHRPVYEEWFDLVSARKNSECLPLIRWD